MGQAQSSNDQVVQDTDHFKELIFASVMCKVAQQQKQDQTGRFSSQFPKSIFELNANFVEHDDNNAELHALADELLEQGLASQVLQDLAAQLPKRGTSKKTQPANKVEKQPEEPVPVPAQAVQVPQEDTDLGTERSFVSNNSSAHVPKRKPAPKKRTSRIAQKSKTLEKRVASEKAKVQHREDDSSSNGSSSICLGEPLSINFQ